MRAVWSVEQHVLRLLPRSVSHCHIYIVNIIYSNGIMKQMGMAKPVRRGTGETSSEMREKQQRFRLQLSLRSQVIPYARHGYVYKKYDASALHMVGIVHFCIGMRATGLAIRDWRAG